MQQNSDNLQNQKQKTLGILTGLSYLSGIEYYKNINDQFMNYVGKKYIIPPNPPILLYSIDLDIYHKYLKNNQIDEANQHIIQGIKKLQYEDIVVIAANTPHMAYKDIIKEYPEIKFLHISDALAFNLKQQNITKIGLLGTYATMKQDFIKDRLKLHGIETIVPENDQQMKDIYNFILNELCQQQFKKETHQYFSNIILDLKNRGAQGCILGCTEIELLLTEPQLHDIPLFPTAQIHQEAIIKILTNQLELKDYLPLQQ